MTAAKDNNHILTQTGLVDDAGNWKAEASISEISQCLAQANNEPIPETEEFILKIAAKDEFDSSGTLIFNSGDNNIYLNMASIKDVLAGFIPSLCEISVNNLNQNSAITLDYKGLFTNTADLERVDAVNRLSIILDQASQKLHGQLASQNGNLPNMHVSEEDHDNFLKWLNTLPQAYQKVLSSLDTAVEYNKEEDSSNTNENIIIPLNMATYLLTQARTSNNKYYICASEALKLPVFVEKEGGIRLSDYIKKYRDLYDKERTDLLHALARCIYIRREKFLYWLYHDAGKDKRFADVPAPEVPASFWGYRENDDGPMSWEDGNEMVSELPLDEAILYWSNKYKVQYIKELHPTLPNPMKLDFQLIEKDGKYPETDIGYQITVDDIFDERDNDPIRSDLGLYSGGITYVDSNKELYDLGYYNTCLKKYVYAPFLMLFESEKMGMKDSKGKVLPLKDIRGYLGSPKNGFDFSDLSTKDGKYTGIRVFKLNLGYEGRQNNITTPKTGPERAKLLAECKNWLKDVVKKSNGMKQKKKPEYLYDAKKHFGNDLSERIFNDAWEDDKVVPLKWKKSNYAK